MTDFSDPPRLMCYRDGYLPPIVLMVLMHIHAIAAPLEKSGWPPSDARAAALAFLLANGLVERDGVEGGSGWQTTPKGAAHVKALGALRLPRTPTTQGKS